MDILGRVGGTGAKAVLGVVCGGAAAGGTKTTTEFRYYQFHTSGDAYFTGYDCSDLRFSWYDNGATGGSNYLWFAGGAPVIINRTGSAWSLCPANSLRFGVGVSSSTVARSTGWHTFRLLYASGSMYVYYDGVLKASGSFEHVFSAAGWESTVGSDFHFKDIYYAVGGGALQGPFFSADVAGVGSGFATTIYSGTAALTRETHTVTVTTPPPTPGRAVILGRPSG